MKSADYESIFRYNAMNIAGMLACGETLPAQIPPELLAEAKRFLDSGELPSYERADRAARDRSYGIRV